MIHSHENNRETQAHLEEHLSKFSGDCLTVMKLLYSGIKLTGYDLIEKYKISDRRLRECYTARPDIVKKHWVRSSDGKTKFMEYYIENIKQPTKAMIVENWDKLIQMSLL